MSVREELQKELDSIRLTLSDPDAFHLGEDKFAKMEERANEIENLLKGGE